LKRVTSIKASFAIRIIAIINHRWLWVRSRYLRYCYHSIFMVHYM